MQLARNVPAFFIARPKSGADELRFRDRCFLRALERRSQEKRRPQFRSKNSEDCAYFIPLIFRGKEAGIRRIWIEKRRYVVPFGFGRSRSAFGRA